MYQTLKDQRQCAAVEDEEMRNWLQDEPEVIVSAEELERMEF
ncbi:hypothetical protein [Vibrio atypicus]|jgi:hypothetical protein|nr:hypothetical protein [Vibrio atypicus]